MFVRHRRWLPIFVSSMAVFIAVAVAGRAGADEPAAKSATQPTAESNDDAKQSASADDLNRWAKDLDSDIFVNRQDARRKLFEAGQKAIEPLSDVAQGKSLEATTAAIDVLHRLAQSSDRPTADAAKAALEKLAKGEHAAAAGLAKEALVPAPTPNAAPANPFGPNIGGGIQIGGNIQIRGGGNIQLLPGGNIQPIPGGAIQVFQIQANAANGQKSTDVDDNGKKIHIQEDQNGIEVRVTEKVNGQDKTDTYKAKDLDELKKKYPEGAKLYDKYGQNGAGGIGNLQIQVGGAALPNFGPVPGVPGAPGINPRPLLPPKAADRGAVTQIDEARKLIAEATRDLKKNASPHDDDSTKSAIEKLDRATEKLDAAKENLGR